MNINLGKPGLQTTNQHAVPCFFLQIKIATMQEGTAKHYKYKKNIEYQILLHVLLW